MPMKYTAGELRAWHRGHRTYREGKPYICHSKDANYRAAWRAGYIAAEREAKKENNK